MRLKQTFVMAAVMILLSVIGYSGYMLWDIYSHQAKAHALHQQLLAYSPLGQGAGAEALLPLTPNVFNASNASTLAAPAVVNQSIINLQARHPHVVGWLSIPDVTFGDNLGGNNAALIDHPFVQYQDNAFYLHHNIDRQRCPAGTVFMDYRHAPDFSHFHTLLYGHHMNNGSMFAPIGAFACADFFNQHPYGYIFLPNQSYTIQFFAFAVVGPRDPVIYQPLVDTVAKQQYFINYVQEVALHHRPEVAVDHNSRLITLSTCRNDQANSRLVLLGKLVANV